MLSNINYDGLYHYFQPIYTLSNWEKKGYEVLIRSENYNNIESLFRVAMKEKNLFELDTFSINQAFSTCFNQKDNVVGSLFVNIFISTILNADFEKFIERLVSKFPQSNKHVVFEISESSDFSDVNLLKQRLSFLKKIGFFIAIDDLGKDGASLTRVIELEPHFIKLDLYFSKDLAVNKSKQNMIKSLTTYSEAQGIDIILEGIEYEDDLAIAKELGVTMGQGYLLGKPNYLNKALANERALI